MKWLVFLLKKNDISSYYGGRVAGWFEILQMFASILASHSWLMSVKKCMPMRSQSSVYPSCRSVYWSFQLPLRRCVTHNRCGYMQESIYVIIGWKMLLEDLIGREGHTNDMLDLMENSCFPNYHISFSYIMGVVSVLGSVTLASTTC